MKRTSIFYFSLAAIAAGSMASCQDYDPLDENTLQAVTVAQKFKATLKEYTDNFEKRYGKIDPNHDWGMSLFVNASQNTRAAEVRKNMWIDQFHLQVPGFPDTYYIEGVDELKSNGYHVVDNSGNNPEYMNSKPTGSDNKLPAGDVTDEEIQYVSWWFRTNQYPESINLHWTDFYVQGISADNDRNTDGTIINTLNHYQKNNSGEWVIGSTDQNVTYSIDYFSAELLQKTVPTSDPGAWDHINNFNRSSSNQLDGVSDLPMEGEDWKTTLGSDNKNNTSADISKRQIMLYYSSGTENFRAHYSNDNADRDWNINYTADGQEIPGSGHSSWVLRHLTFTGKSGRLYDGYYLAFDYQCYKQEQIDQNDGSLVKYTLHPADGYYSNWIFKLSPATPLEEPELVNLSRRIMCEDLGNTYDFDFNDVVFDATYNITASDYDNYLHGYKTDSPIDVTIRLQAAGGTMPIYVGVTPGQANMEAHQLLGNHRSDTPVNVDAPSGATSPIAIYHYKLTFPSNLTSENERKQALSLNNIPIYVQNNGNIGGTYLTSSNAAWGNEYSPEENRPTPQNPGDVSAPRAFGVPVGVKWMKECEFIEDGYTYFSKWVNDMSTYGDDSQNPWYKGPFGTTSKIYNY